jgi:glc operon protein GlcG
MLSHVRFSCMFLFVLGASLLLGGHALSAETPPDRLSVLNASNAKSIIDGCIAYSNGKGQSHAIAIMDANGALVAFVSMDGNSRGVGEFAIQKARAVAYWKFSTDAMSKAAEATPGFADAPSIVTVAGGVPIFSPDGRVFLGSVGISGEMPSEDVACGVAGIKAAGLLDRRS